MINLILFFLFIISLFLFTFACLELFVIPNTSMAWTSVLYKNKYTHRKLYLILFISLLTAISSFTFIIINLHNKSIVKNNKDFSSLIIETTQEEKQRLEHNKITKCQTMFSDLIKIKDTDICAEYYKEQINNNNNH